MTFILAIVLAFVPVYDEGRVRPGTIEDELVLPAYDGRYLPLSHLASPINPTSWPDSDYAALRSCWQAGDRRGVEKVLYAHADSKWRLHLEHFYQLIPVVPLLTCLYLVFRRKWWIPWTVHSLVLAARILILGRAPVATMYDTLLFVPWVAALFRMPLIGYVNAALLIMAMKMRPDGGLDVIQPVLRSNLYLATHVVCVVASYGVYLVCALYAHVGLFAKTFNPKPLIRAMYIGTALLIGGTLLGGVWAAESWGRFWDWDPKEAWAFISAGAFLFTIHAYQFKLIGERGLCLCCATAFLAVTFTWYGVNYILGTGLHSYGFGSGNVVYYIAFVLGDSALVTGRYLFLKKRASTTTEKPIARPSPHNV